MATVTMTRGAQSVVSQLRGQQLNIPVFDMFSDWHCAINPNYEKARNLVEGILERLVHVCATRLLHNVDMLIPSFIR
jgi:hypothetical protein